MQSFSRPWAWGARCPSIDNIAFTLRISRGQSLATRRHDRSRFLRSVARRLPTSLSGRPYSSNYDLLGVGRSRLSSLSVNQIKKDTGPSFLQAEVNLWKLSMKCIGMSSRTSELCFWRFGLINIDVSKQGFYNKSAPKKNQSNWNRLRTND